MLIVLEMFHGEKWVQDIIVLELCERGDLYYLWMKLVLCLMICV